MLKLHTAKEKEEKEEKEEEEEEEMQTVPVSIRMKSNSEGGNIFLSASSPQLCYLNSPCLIYGNVPLNIIGYAHMSLPIQC